MLQTTIAQEVAFPFTYICYQQIIDDWQNKIFIKIQTLYCLILHCYTHPIISPTYPILMAKIDRFLFIDGSIHRKWLEEHLPWLLCIDLIRMNDVFIVLTFDMHASSQNLKRSWYFLLVKFYAVSDRHVIPSVFYLINFHGHFYTALRHWSTPWYILDF